ncbi:uncharacterized protein LOC126827649 [Patella vulgata]|uniref:uncharacterized protein LOC126827649 n=1 Tax=Patella vulgata TaxID=6465 RepID=UPI0024A90F87|nr:uncharacterized protein LOC126827649 [Patella vulgata]
MNRVNLLRELSVPTVVAIAVIGITVAQLQTGTGQQLPAGTGQQQEQVCMSQFDTNLGPRCFESFNVSFEGVLFIISQGQNGQLPAGTTAEALRDLTCQHARLDLIIPCVLQLMNFFTNQTSCAQQEREMIDGSAKRLLTIMDQLCIQPCEIETSQRAMQCFASAQIDPNRAMNSSMVADKFAILGNTTAEIQRFCSNHNTLFTCLDTEKAKCPAFENRMYEMGIDFTSMKLATAVLCQRQQEYVNGLQCFSQYMASTQQCLMTTGRGVQELMLGRFQTGAVRPSEMTDRFCALRLQKVPCELQVYSQSCAENLNTLRNQFECNILAAPCRNNPNFKQIVDSMCQSSAPQAGQGIIPQPAVPVINTNINDFAKPQNNINMNTNVGNSVMQGASPDSGARSFSGCIFTTSVLLFGAILLF